VAEVGQIEKSRLRYSLESETKNQRTSKISFTQPIRIQFESKSLTYRSGRWLAYPALFILLAGDGVRYLIGWYAFGVVAAVAVIAATVFIARNPDRSIIKRFPIPLALLLIWMSLSVVWSNYQLVSLGAVAVQVATTVIAMFFAVQFDWRQLLNIFANTIRVVLILSLLIELLAAITGPIKPPFANFEGDEPPAPAYWWVQGNLFQSERIQGFVGNANLIAFIGMLGLAVFFVEYLVRAKNQKIALASMVAAAGFIALAKSATMLAALVIVVTVALIAMIAEGKSRARRHKIYRVTLWSSVFGIFLAAVYWVEITDLLGKSPDASGRFSIWQTVFGLVSERWQLGWGWISHWIPGVAPYEGLIEIDGVPHFHAHNAFLDVWLQLGLVGLVIFTWLLISTFVRVWRVAVVHTSPLYLWPLFAFMVIATQAVAESRILIENGWVMLVLMALKSRELFENLEPLGITPKTKKLFRVFAKPSATDTGQKLKAKETNS
jgi:exopolysaccharide production protein ExoQ